jgi:GTPase SAR1 family protein
MSGAASPHALVSLFFPANSIPDSFILSIPRKVTDLAVDGTADLELSETLDGADILIEFNCLSSAGIPSTSASTSPQVPSKRVVTATVRGSSVTAFSMELPADTTFSQQDAAVPATWLPELTSFVLDCVLGPREVLYDGSSKSLTTNAVFALRRAFWLMDKDKNGLLSRTEAAMWPQILLPAELGTDGMDEEQFMQHAVVLLAAGHHRAVWEPLKAQHISPKTALPFNAFDIASVKVDDSSQLYLSHVAVQFFVSLYQLDRFPKLDDMWRLVPGGCPWRAIASLRSSSIPLDQFMECWKLMTWLNRDAVVKCARTWGFRGEPQQLFVKRKCRGMRTNDESLPNALKVLVIGSPRCGRSSLINAVCERADVEDRDEGSASGSSSARSAPATEAVSGSPRGAGVASLASMFVRTITVPDESSKQPVTLIYVKLDDADTSRVVITPALQKQFDVMLLCFEGCDAYSCSYWMERYQLAVALKPLRLPFILVGTKCDVPMCEQAAENVVDQFCRSNRLSWPPLYTSGVVDPGEAPCGIANEVSQLNDLVVWVAQWPERALAPAEITPARYARRVLIVLGGLVIVTAGARALLRLLWRRPTPAITVK